MSKEDNIPWYGWLVIVLFAIVMLGGLVYMTATNDADNVDRKIAPEFRGQYANEYELIMKLEVKRDYRAYTGEELPKDVLYAYYDITVTAIINDDGVEKAVQHKYVCCCYYERVIMFPFAKDIILDCDFCRLEVS